MREFKEGDLVFWDDCPGLVWIFSHYEFSELSSTSIFLSSFHRSGLTKTDEKRIRKAKMEIAEVWSTKNALNSKGIEFLKGAIKENGYFYYYPDFYSKYYLIGEGKQWHRTKEQAIARAEEMRLNKINSLKAQIEELEKLSFED
jgi:hypothetical protein